MPLSGRGNVVNTLNRSRLVRVELDPAVEPARGPAARASRRSPAASSSTSTSTQARLSPDDYVGDAADRTGFAGLETIPDVTMVAVPDAMAAYQQGVIDLEGLKAIQLGMIAHCELMGNRVAILDAPPSMNAQQVKDWRMDQAGYDSKFAALYWPWIKVFDPSTGREHVRPAERPRRRHLRAATTTPAACTRRRPTRSSAAPSTSRSTSPRASTTLLNPVGVNCIRSFPGRGIRIWGARTLSSDPEWRYLNVRRLFNYLEDSILNGTQWAVFEPNDHALWAKLRRSIAAFLVMEWRKGALFGLTPERGVLRQVRRRDEPGRGDRRRPGDVRDRRGAGQAGRVRRSSACPSSPAAPASSPSDRPSRNRRGADPWPFPISTPPSATPSASSSTASMIKAIQEVSGLKMEQDVIELKQNTPDGKYMIKKLPGPARRPARSR